MTGQQLTALDKERFTCQVLDDFVDTIRRLLDLAWGAKWGEFTEEYTAYGDSENEPLPRIVFRLYSRKPHDKLSPLKEKNFGVIPDPEYPNQYIEIWRKWYDCVIKFYCFDKTNRGARALADKLERFISTYTGFFKERGLSELIFLGEDAPELLDTRHGNKNVRILVYTTRVEEVRIVRSKALEDITIQLKNQE